MPQRLLAEGAAGYIMKQAAASQLINALRAVLRGERYVSEALQQNLVSRSDTDGGGSTRLSARELQVISLIGRGLGTRADRRQPVVVGQDRGDASPDHQAQAGTRYQCATGAVRDQMARHTRRLILWIGGGVLALVLLAVLAVLALVWLVDPNVYRSRIAARRPNALGRPVTLGGDLRWNIGWDIGIESTDGSIGNAPGFGETPFARWRSLRLGLDTRALMRQRCVIDQLELDGLELNLQRNAAGEGNWIFTPQAKPDDGEGRQVDLQVAFDPAA